MAGAAIEHAGMHAGARASRKAIKEIVNQFGLQIADQAGANFGVHGRGGTAAKIYRCQAESFIHRHHEIAGAQNPALGAQRLVEELAQHNADILDGVVLIDIKVAFGFELKIEAAMMSE